MNSLLNQQLQPGLGLQKEKSETEVGHPSAPELMCTSRDRQGVRCRARPGGVNTQNHMGFCSDPEQFTDRRAERLLFNFGSLRIINSFC